LKEQLNYGYIQVSYFRRRRIMNVAKLNEDQLRAVFAPREMDRAEGSIGQFYDCTVKNGDLHATIRGNHGYYQVTLYTSKNPIKSECNCKASADGPCKHGAALGLSYIYTPWVFRCEDHIDRNKLETVEDIHFYVSITPLRQLLDELKAAGFSVTRFSELVGVTPQQVAAVVKATEGGAQHMMGGMMKMACLYLLEHKALKA
jgi:hypothetical protein